MQARCDAPSETRNIRGADLHAQLPGSGKPGDASQRAFSLRPGYQPAIYVSTDGLFEPEPDDSIHSMIVADLARLLRSGAGRPKVTQIDGTARPRVGDAAEYAVRCFRKLEQGRARPGIWIMTEPHNLRSFRGLFVHGDREEFQAPDYSICQLDADEFCTEITPQEAVDLLEGWKEGQEAVLGTLSRHKVAR